MNLWGPSRPVVVDDGGALPSVVPPVRTTLDVRERTSARVNREGEEPAMDLARSRWRVRSLGVG